MFEDKTINEEGEITTPEMENISEVEEENLNEESMKSKKKRSDDSTEAQLEEMGGKLLEMNDKYLRLSAEFDNYRKRTLKERMELTRTAGEQLLTGILPVVDNFERALLSISKSSGSDDVKALEEGVRLIYNDFKDYLERNGVKEIETNGVDFNTDLHEAVTVIPAPTPQQKGKIIDTVEKGYTLNDKVIRYAKVVVGE